MNQQLFIYVSIIAIFVLGTLAHFLYDISKENKILGLFTAVNESTWEHIKIAITPMLLWSLVDGFLYGSDPNYFPAKLTSLVLVSLFIPIIFYSYTRITKKPVFPVDILTFLAAIVISEMAFFLILDFPPCQFVVSYLCAIGTFVFFGAYMTLTLMPLKQLVFKDPITGKYGFPAHRNFFKSLRKKTNKKP